ncbi:MULTISPECIES: hypothetical protein [unclassified Chryseobacterium]|uniref:hypothetical protein n=1 Tax=unclassified Chryseobacterium TaxID=2593645 RepID=UPI0006466136|nr:MULTISPECIES: hypothetical protein [unclassified Chryseobacterium]SHG29269.1 hypothetical protein SAMN02787100_3715 [Chryseobacterium sp. OV279]HCA08764.1 hypothetical protein [Chryseobacterium sp.]
MMDNVEQKVSEILRTITGENQLFNDLTDEEKIQMLPSESMLTLQFVTYLEEEFDIEFDDEELDISFFESFENVINAVTNHVNEKIA